MSTAYAVGQQVWVNDVNQSRLGGPARGEVVKVGRTLVHVNYGYRTETFCLADGARNDKYRHQWIETDEQREVRLHRADLLRRLNDVGLRFDPGKTPNADVLAALVSVYEDASARSTPTAETPSA